MSRRFLTADWRWVAMVNYEVDPGLIEPLVPAGTRLDQWEGKTFLSLVGFLFMDTKLFGVPVPAHQKFEEVNLRFYVTREAGAETRRGVVFLKEIVPKPMVARVARWFYGENYVDLPMGHYIGESDIEFSWHSIEGGNRLRVSRCGEAQRPVEGSLEQFIAEHYWGYTRRGPSATSEYRVEHSPWRVWQTKGCKVEVQAASLYGQEFIAVLKGEPVSAMVAEGSPVVVYKGAKLS
jgi:uncharacterized protein YqjF (DUF2071 family)